MLDHNIQLHHLSHFWISRYFPAKSAPATLSHNSSCESKVPQSKHSCFIQFVFSVYYTWHLLLNWLVFRRYEAFCFYGYRIWVLPGNLPEKLHSSASHGTVHVVSPFFLALMIKILLHLLNVWGTACFYLHCLPSPWSLLKSWGQ